MSNIVTRQSYILALTLIESVDVRKEVIILLTKGIHEHFYLMAIHNQKNLLLVSQN